MLCTIYTPALLPKLMLKRQPYYLYAALLLTLAACSKNDSAPPTPEPPAIVIAAPPDFGFKVVGYFPSYRDVNAVPDIKFRMTNVVNYAFFTVNSSGGLTINNPSTFAAVITKAKANNAKVMIAINGASADFKTMAATATGRNNFIKLLMGYVRSYQVHGVDMDWEFPTTTDGSDITFTALMKELSDSCHRDAKYYLTAAITAGKYAGGNRDAIKAELFNYVDWFNVMVYDDFNTTVPYKQHSDMALVTTCMNYWLTTRSMPKSKFVLGLPAYGRPSGITQSGTVWTYSSIINAGGSPLSDSAVVSNSAWPSPYTVYYNGQPTIKKKAMLAKQQGAGIMLWEKGQDSHDATSLLKAACDTIGRTY
jgi:GH18 family chitinase